MYMRALQIDLINIGITLQFEKKIDMVRANKLEGVLSKYSTKPQLLKPPSVSLLGEAY